MGYIGQVPTAIPLTSADITDGTIALADMAANSIDSDQYVDGSIDTAHIATNQIDETLIKDAFVGDFSDVTVTAADAFLYGDATDSGNTKKDTVQGILDLVSAGMKVYLGSSTFNATSATGTNLVISGIVDASSVAFTPKAVFVIASTHGAGNSFSWLVDPARSQDYISSNFAVGGNFGTGINNIFCECPNSGATQTFTTSAWTSGGYTMANTKAGSATGTLYWRYMAIA